MKYGDRFTFWYLLKEYKIQIPEIQRDYVQGRNNDIVKRNKENLIKFLVSAIVDGKNVDLNFTYGKKNNDLFIPIDGQQRLTTLYLLHFYISIQNNKISDDKLVFENFDYVTRRTSHKFLTLLLENYDKLESCADKSQVAKNIENSSWFIKSFYQDLTIVSMLSVLKQMELEFKNYTNNDWDLYYKSLFSENNAGCPITFMFIDLDMSSDDNELYVKMNSRGKQLTDFENFKSDLYEFLDNQLKSIDDNELNDIKEKIEEFKINIDGKWLDYIWDYDYINARFKKIIEDKALYIDKLFKNLFHYLFINEIVASNVCNNEESTQYKWISPNSKFNTSSAVNMTFLDQYINSKAEDTAKILRTCMLETVMDFTYIMNYFCMSTDGKLIEEFDTYLDILEKKRSIVVKNVFNISGYNERINLYILCMLRKCDKKYNEIDFNYYRRTMYHILINSEVDSEAKFVRFIQDVTATKDYCENFRDFSLLPDANYAKDSKFDSEISKEELLKNRLRYKNNDWDSVITNAELCSEYLKYEIGFVFDFVGINEKDYNDINKIEKFKKYAGELKDIFNNWKEKPNYLHRVLLCYLYPTSNQLLSFLSKRNNDIYSYCSNRPMDVRHRTHDWRGQLLFNPYLKGKFKLMFDEYVTYRTTNPNKHFEDFAKMKISKIRFDETDSEKALITTVVTRGWYLPFKDGIHSYYFLKNGNSYSFLKTTQRHEWVDVHLYELFKNLSDLGINRIKLMNEDGNYILKIRSNKIKYDITSNEYYVETTTIRNKRISDFIVSLRTNKLIRP